MDDAQRERAEQLLVQHLHEAHATELSVASTLASHIGITPAGRYRVGLEAHLKETRPHAEWIQRNLESRDQGRGLVQLGYGVAQGVVGQVMALSKLPIDLVRGTCPEEMLLRNARDECATEAIEIANYLAIEELARQLGDEETVKMAVSIRQEEEKMLARLQKEIPRLAADVVSAEVDGRSQFVASRVGAVDTARSLASTAARSVARRARRTARRNEQATATAPRTPGTRSVRSSSRSTISHGRPRSSPKKSRSGSKSRSRS